MFQFLIYVKNGYFPILASGIPRCKLGDAACLPDTLTQVFQHSDGKKKFGFFGLFINDLMKLNF